MRAVCSGARQHTPFPVVPQEHDSSTSEYASLSAIMDLACSNAIAVAVKPLADIPMRRLKLPKGARVVTGPGHCAQL